MSRKGSSKVFSLDESSLVFSINAAYPIEEKTIKVIKTGENIQDLDIKTIFPVLFFVIILFLPSFATLSILLLGSRYLHSYNV